MTSWRGAGQVKGLEVEAHILPRAEQHSEIGTGAFFSAAIYAAHAALNPALYHHGMLPRAQASGASVIAPCAAYRYVRFAPESWRQSGNGPKSASCQ